MNSDFITCTTESPDKSDKESISEKELAALIKKQDRHV